MEEKIDWGDIYPRINRKVKRQLRNLPVSVVEEGISKATEYVLLNLPRLLAEGTHIENYLTMASISRSLGVWRTEQKRLKYVEQLHDGEETTSQLIQDFETSTLTEELSLLISEINSSKRTIINDNKTSCWLIELETILKKNLDLEETEQEVISSRQKFPRPSIHKLRQQHLRPRLKEILDG